MQCAPCPVAAVTALSYDAAAAHVTANEPMFEVTRAMIRGTHYNVFKNIPPTVPALLRASRAAHDDGRAEYLVFEDERRSFDDFAAEVNGIAHMLRSRLGVRKGQPVGIAMRNCPELLTLILAIASSGAVVVFLNAWWTQEELDYAIADSGARIVFADGARLDRLDGLRRSRQLTLIAVRDGETTGKAQADHHFNALLRDAGAAADAQNWPDPELATDDDFAVMYSSGSTGTPKGVVQTHRGAVNAVFTWLMQAVMAPLITPPDPGAPPPPRPSVLVVTPLFHVTATHPMFLLSLPAGAKLAVMAKWDAQEAVRIIRDERITRFLGVPTQSADLMAMAEKMQEPLPTLDFLGAGGAKRPAAQVAELKRTFGRAEIATGWGMTETNANGIGMVGADYLARPGAAGRLYPPVQELRFLGDDGHDVAQGEIGELTVKSPCNMRCYLGKPEATAETMQDGWLRTGDLGRIDAEGFVTIVDRKKNIVIRGGENIACLDVEGALHRHPDIFEACAFSLPHERLGEVVGARVQTRQGSDPQEAEIKAFLAGHIAHFKIPERIWIGASPLLRGATDKIDRRAIRAACIADLDA